MGGGEQLFFESCCIAMSPSLIITTLSILAKNGWENSKVIQSFMIYINTDINTLISIEITHKQKQYLRGMRK
jgi:hypothetical protein